MPQAPKGKRRTGKAYRRKMKVKRRDDLMRIVKRCRLSPAGYVDWAEVDGAWKPVGKYIKYPRNSNAQQYLKRCANKAVRRRNELYRGNQYRKCFDYQWLLW